MASFNQFSQIEPFVREKLDSRIGRPEVVSKLNTWVRLFSSKYTEGIDDVGLILVSNPDYKLFRAAGDNLVSTIYGGGTQSGVIGVSWGGTPIYDEGGVGLRPSPVVTSIEVDEGMSEALSRKATVTIKAFTKQQMEKITEYFLEPGFTVFLEWGWNTIDSANQIQSFDKDVGKVLTYIKDTNNFTKLSERRKNSKGDYDSYLGYITGGGVSTSGDTWDITVELVGLPELPFYLRMQKTQTSTREGDTVEVTTDKRNLFRPSEITSATSPAKKAFMQMYNDLPEVLQITEVRNLINNPKFNINSLLNFDKDNRENLNSAISGNTVKSENFTRTVRVGSSTGTTTEEKNTIKFPRKKNIADNRYIRMDALFTIIQSILQSYTDKTLGNVNIDINNTIISAFPNIFSLDGSVLFIPNENTPKYTIGEVLTDDTNRPSETMDNSIDNIKFPRNVPVGFNTETLKFTNDIGSNVTLVKDAGNWGGLIDLYVNFDFATRILSTKNFILGDVVKNLLNGISRAVNNYWNFQIIEDVDNDNETIKLQIIDQNFSPNYTTEGEYTFTNIGEKSIFMDSSFSLDIGGALSNRIIGQRLSNNVNSNQPHTGLFSPEPSKDKVLDVLQTRTNSTGSVLDTTTTASDETDEEKLQAQLELYLGKVAIIPKPNLIIDGRVERVLNFFSGQTRLGNTIESVALFTAYNDTEFLEYYHFLAEKRDEGKDSAVSPLLPIKFSFTIHGISGIKRFDTFKINGIPSHYEQNGFFQVTSIKHSIQDMKWSTTIEGQFRNKLKRGQPS